MRVLILSDYIHHYDSSRLILESLMGLGEDVEIATLFFSEDKLETPLSLYKIHSTVLTKLFSTPHQLFKWPIFTSQIAKRFKLEDYDKYIILSTGFSHLVNVPEEKVLFRYIYDRPYRVSKLFADSLDRNFVKGLKKFKNLYFSSHYLANTLGFKENYQVMMRPFPSKDFKQIGDYQNSRKYVLNIDEYRETDLEEFIKLLGLDSELVIITNAKTKKLIKKDYPFLEILSGMSNHELYVELLRARLYIDLRDVYPERVFCSLSTGIPAVVKESLLNREVFGDGAVKCVKDLKELIQNFESFDRNTIDGETLRRFSLRYNERVFKNKILNMLRKQ